MKTRIAFSTLLILLICGCINLATPEIEKAISKQSNLTQTDRDRLTKFTTLDTREILKRLFDNPAFDNSGMAIWEGSYSDLTSLSIPLSHDGKFHTSLDTILYFEDTKKRKCAVAIFSTYNLQHDPFDSLKIQPTGCHFCGVPIGVALFHKTENKDWALYDFEKEIVQLGYFSVYKTGNKDEGKIQLKEVGDHWTTLSITQGLGGNGGYLEGREQLFSVEEFKMDGSPSTTLKLLFANYYNMTETFLNRSILPEIKPIRKENNYYDLEILTIDDDIVKTKTYKYSIDCEQYLDRKHYR